MSQNLKSLLNMPSLSDSIKEQIKELFNEKNTTNTFVKPMILQKDIIELLIQLISINDCPNVILHTPSGVDIMNLGKISRNKQSLAFIEKTHNDELLKNLLKEELDSLAEIFDENFESSSLNQTVSFLINNEDCNPEYKFLLKLFLETNDLMYLLLFYFDVKLICKVKNNLPKILEDYKEDVYTLYNNLVGSNE